MAFSWPPTIRKGQRVTFVGPSGSGKTELAKSFLKTQSNVIILDTKRVEDFSDVGEVLGEKDIFRARGGRWIYRVDPEFLVDPAKAQKFFAWSLARGNCVIYVDEQGNVPATNAEKILATQGRASRVGLWIGTQRVFGVPLYSISEANHTFIFRLRLDNDRKRMETAISSDEIPWDDSRMRAKHSFLYIDEAGDPHGPYKLSLGE